MLELTLPFIISQIAMLLAMISDFLGFQYKKRQHTFLCFIISASLICLHYFLLGKLAAGVIVFFSVLRFITCYFTTNKKYLALFVVLNTVTLFFTYREVFDLIIYTGLIINIVANFQENNKLMRKMMMAGTSLVALYNILIISPMGALTEGLFLVSNFIGYYRIYIKKNKPKNEG